MPFTLVHGLVAYFIVLPFTKSRKLRLLAFAAGMLPDLDGVPLLFDMNLYYQLHHELLHAPIYGVLLAIPVALLLSKYFGMSRNKTALVFASAFMAHSITDVFFTNWPVKILWPISAQQFSYPIFISYNWFLALAVVIALITQFILSKLPQNPAP